MKHIKHVNEFFQKINENLIFPLFKNEKQLKDKLVKKRYFADGNISDAITNVIYAKWQSDNNIRYDQILDWTRNEYGLIPYFTMMFSVYDGQVCNGGHSQYFYNGYASSNSRGVAHTYNDIDKHEKFVKVFNDLNLREILPYGNKMYNIISSFTLELDNEIEECSNCGGSGEVECSECGGDGEIECSNCGGTGEDVNGETCEECGGSGQVDCDECNTRGIYKCDDCGGGGEYDTGRMVPDTNFWSKLDTQWYEINESVEEQYNNYLKTLTLDGEKIGELVEIAKSTQKYNI